MFRYELFSATRIAAAFFSFLADIFCILTFFTTLSINSFANVATFFAFTITLDCVSATS